MSARGSKYHRRLRCEIYGCDNTFFVYGRHHCRSCGASVCAKHFLRPFCDTCKRDSEAIRSVKHDALQPGSSSEEDGQVVPRGTEDCELCKDVYATIFTLANNATPGMYSVWPWRNKAMGLAFGYLGFTVFAQVLEAKPHPPAPLQMQPVW